MSREDENKAIVGRWFTKFWGETCDLGIVDELAAPDMLLQYSLHEPRRGREDIKAFMTDFRKAFPDLNFWGAADLIAEGDYVVVVYPRPVNADDPAKAYSTTWFDMWRFVDGKADEHWDGAVKN